MYLSSFIHLNTIGTSERLESKRTSKMNKDRKQKPAWASEHSQNFTMKVMPAKEKREANLDPREDSICALSNLEVNFSGRGENKEKGYRQGRRERGVRGRGP
jgi:hypothetical protein